MIFLTGPPLKMSPDWPPQICLDWPPPKFSKCWNHIHFARHLDVFRSKGGPVWDSDVFLKSVTCRPTLSEFRGGPAKKHLAFDESLMVFGSPNNCVSWYSMVVHNQSNDAMATCPRLSLVAFLKYNLRNLNLCRYMVHRLFAERRT